MAQQQESWLRRNRKYLVLACAATSSIAVYRVYRSERIKATQKALQSLQETIAKYTDAAASAGSVLAVVAEDLRNFFDSDADEVPRSIRQLGKLARSTELQDTLAACVSSMAKGLLTTPAEAGGVQAGPSALDKIIDALLSDRGHSMVGLAIRTAAQTSTDVFCNALLQGIQAATGSQLVEQQQPSVLQPHRQVQPLRSPSTSPQTSPFRSHHTQHNDGLQSGVAILVNVLGNPQVLNLIDNLVSTTVGSAIGAYIQKAGQESMMTSVMDCLAQPGNKEIIIDVMSSVSAAFCREMAAACVAPASSVATRPSSRLASPEQHIGSAAHAAASPLKSLAHSYSQGSVGQQGSEPSTPQSGPSTPEPSIVAEPAGGIAGFGRNSFAGSAVAGLILRRNSFPGAGWIGSAANVTADPAALGPMSTLVSLFVQAARFQEFRSLMVDVSRSSTREFVLSLLPSSWSLSRNGSNSSPMASAALAACMYRVHTTLCVLMFLVLYAVGPRTLLEGSTV